MGRCGRLPPCACHVRFSLTTISGSPAVRYTDFIMWRCPSRRRQPWPSQSTSSTQSRPHGSGSLKNGPALKGCTSPPKARAGRCRRPLPRHLEDLPSIRAPHEPCEPVRSIQACCIGGKWGADGLYEPMHTRRWSVHKDGESKDLRSRDCCAFGREISHRVSFATPMYQLSCLKLSAALGIPYQLSETLPLR